MNRSTRRITLAGTGLAVSALTVVGLVAPATAAPPTTPPTPAAKAAAALEQIKADGAAAIADRQVQLTKLAGRLTEAPTCDTGGVIAGIISTDQSGLAALGGKLAADTTVADARNDAQAIFQQYRVYLVVTPQAYATSACGHVHNAATKLGEAATKLTTRVQAAEAAGADMAAAHHALVDLRAKLTSATTLADKANATLAGIAPDKGDKAVAAANAAAVESARADLTSAHRDLTAAEKDARTVVDELKQAAKRR